MKPTEDLIKEHATIKTMMKLMPIMAFEMTAGKPFKLNDVDRMIYFLRTYVDHYHHRKEERGLFPALFQLGLHNEFSVFRIMLEEHEFGRKNVAEIQAALSQFKAGDEAARAVMAQKMLQYVEKLGAHMEKEETLLFPLADKLLSDRLVFAVLRQYEKIDAQAEQQGILVYNAETLKRLVQNYRGHYVG